MEDRYQQYFDLAIINATEEDKKALYLRKNILIEKAKTIRANIQLTKQKETEDGQLEVFKDEIDKFWKDSVSKFPVLNSTKETVDGKPPKSRTQSYHMKLSYNWGKGDIKTLMSEYQNRSQIIYQDPVPDKIEESEKTKIEEQFESDLTKLYGEISKIKTFPPGPVNVDNIEKKIIEPYIKPYLDFVTKVKDGGLYKSLLEKLKKHILTINLNSDINHAYLHYLCKAQLEIFHPNEFPVKPRSSKSEDEKNKKLKKEDLAWLADSLDKSKPNFIKQHDLKKLADKTEDSRKLKENGLRWLELRLDSLEKEKKGKKLEFLGKIKNNKPTGDLYIDFLTTFIKRERGQLHYLTNKFGETSTFIKLTKLEEKEKIVEENKKD